MRRPVLLASGIAVVTIAAGIAVAASASAGTTTYEAEAAGNTFGGGAHAVGCQRCSGGSRVTGVGGQGVLTITGVVAEEDGPTKLAVTYTGDRNRTAQISVNGAVPTAVVFPSTRGAGRPGTLRVTATLRAGENDLTFSNPVGPAPDVDKVVITTDGTPPTAVPTVTASAEPGATATASPSGSAAPTSTPSDPTASPSETTPTTTPTSPAATPTSTPATSTPATTTPTTPPTTEPATTASPTAEPTGTAALEAEVVTIVNTERAKVGCPAVTADDRLTTAARGHSTDMAARDYFSHTSPEGVEFSTRITDAGYRWSRAGENIAKGQPTPAEVMTAWMNSAGHRANILTCAFKNIGVGVAADAQGTLLWTQDFASPL